MKITTDGNHALSTSGSKSTLYVSGTLGDGTATVGYIASGSFVSLKDSDGADLTLTPEYQYELNHGVNPMLYVQLSGSTDAELHVVPKALN